MIAYGFVCHTSKKKKKINCKPRLAGIWKTGVKMKIVHVCNCKSTKIPLKISLSFLSSPPSSSQNSAKFSRSGPDNPNQKLHFCPTHLEAWAPQFREPQLSNQAGSGSSKRRLTRPRRRVRWCIGCSGTNGSRTIGHWSMPLIRRTRWMSQLLLHLTYLIGSRVLGLGS